MSNNNLLIGTAAFLASAILHRIYATSRKRRTTNKKLPAAAETQVAKVLDLPVVDLNTFFNKDSNPEAYEKECAKVANALHTYGIVILKDPRATEGDNNRFLDMMEKYFELSDGVRDARPEYHYQVGVTPDHRERARNYCKVMGAYDDKNKPLSPCPPELDAKWRFFWRIGPLPEKTRFPALNMDPVIPPEFPEWSEVMNMWGNKMLTAVKNLAEMAAVGFHLPTDTFTSKMKCGPHLLAPTGSDYSKYGQLKSVLAAFHTDLNFLTIHGKARFPGLFIWTRSGEKVSVVVPDGCLLVQAGKQIEYMTGGHVLAGFHEVVVTENTRKIIEARKAKNQSMWRVSSTLFSHIESDVMLQPLEPFAKQLSTNDLQSKFPPIYTGEFVQKELEAIALAAK